MSEINRYPMVVFWSEEDDDYIAVAPDLPKLSGVDGTPARAVKSLWEAIDLYTEACETSGSKLPKPSSYEVVAQLLNLWPEMLRSKVLPGPYDAGDLNRVPEPGDDVIVRGRVVRYSKVEDGYTHIDVGGHQSSVKSSELRFVNRAFRVDEEVYFNPSNPHVVRVKILAIHKDEAWVEDVKNERTWQCPTRLLSRTRVETR